MKRNKIYIALAVMVILLLSLFLYPRMKSISDAKNYSEKELIEKYKKDNKLK